MIAPVGPGHRGEERPRVGVQWVLVERVPVGEELPQLVRQLHIMSARTWVIKDQVAIYDQMIEVLARKTPGYTGADLANVINEAALLTARAGKKQITNEALDEAVDRVMAGPQRRSRVMKDKERLITAYHEGGHALAAAAMTAVVATGGLSHIVVPESVTITNHEPDLTLIGLRLVFEKNT